MKYRFLIILPGIVLLLGSCTFFYEKQSAPPSGMHSPKPLAVPVGKNWQIIEEAPVLSNEQGRLPFQTEQSLQPEGGKSAAPADNRKIETTR
ncbi:MAG: hypothetical protein Q7W05_10040 [Deltaproteobacteria bacterium]|nr:hypothetical protein [Deltaproteobacteria bacterium]